MISKYFILYLIFIAQSVSPDQVNNVMKQKINDAGCSFVAEDQLLEKNVCLMPDYASNEAPKNSKGVTQINLYLLHAFVLEVDEMKNKLTIELLQYLSWSEPRIKANISASTQNKNKIKLSTKNIKRIWHPELDVYTKDLKEWKSLYDPVLYQEIMFSNEVNQKEVKVSALKSWKATVFCKFDFLLFPFDSQSCTFLQFASSQDIRIISNCPKNPSNDKYEPVGFDIRLAARGPFCTPNDSLITDMELLWMNTGFNINLKTIIKPYLYQYYFPSIAIVFVSFISFVIPLNAIPGRMVLVVTQFLTLTNLFIHQMVRIIVWYYHNL